MGSYYRIVQVRHPPTANQLQRREAMCEQERHEYEVMREQYEEEHGDTSEWWDVSFGTAEEARGDYDCDQDRQQQIDAK
jgi:hypothetical protein